MTEPNEWQPTHRHRKGGLYRVICYALRESDLVELVVYEGVNRQAWVRPSSEFHDGRFVPIEPGEPGHE